MHFDVILLAIPGAVLWTGAICLIPAILTIAWLIVHRFRKDRDD
jgi:hypothetical protein